MAFMVTMACGHRIRMDSGVLVPVCPTCGERQVARCNAPAPRFRGMALGPCAEYVELPAKRVDLTTKE